MWVLGSVLRVFRALRRQIVLTLLFLLLASGCQADDSPAISVTPVTASLAPPTQPVSSAPLATEPTISPPPPTKVPVSPPTAAPTASPSSTPASDPLTVPHTLTVPRGTPPDIDGTISPGEWDAAAVETFSDGSELLLMFGDGYLYLGIRANTPEMIAGNIFVHRGDEITILHSSAALGTALYESGTASWLQTQVFDWRCRKTDDGEAARAERETFLQDDHWVAANSRMGAPNELEYQIEVMDEDLRLAANFIRTSNTSLKIPWPADLDDDCIKPTPGGLPVELDFSPDKWATIGIPALER